jgi:hypothetical protein
MVRLTFFVGFKLRLASGEEFVGMGLFWYI